MLTAEWRGDLVVSRSFVPEHWLEFRSEVRAAGGLRCPECGGRCHPYTAGRYAIRAFRHASGEAAKCHERLSERGGEHDYLKTRLIDAVEKVKGWTARPEVALGACRFDVLAQRQRDDGFYRADDRQGFEVQLSHQTDDRTIERQVESVRHTRCTTWIVRSTPSWSLLVPCVRFQRAATGTEYVTGVHRKATGWDGGYVESPPMPASVYVRKQLLDRLAPVAGYGLVDLDYEGDGKTRPGVRRRQPCADDERAYQSAQMRCERGVSLLRDPRAGSCLICGQDWGLRSEDCLRAHS